MQITYQFRLYPTPEQEERMIRTLILCRKLYNRAKEQRDSAYNQEGTTVTYAKQQNELPAFKKEFPEYKKNVYRRTFTEARPHLAVVFLAISGSLYQEVYTF